jgi:hypothetical protein
MLALRVYYNQEEYNRRLPPWPSNRGFGGLDFKWIFELQPSTRLKNGRQSTKNSFGVVGDQYLHCISPAELSATERKEINDSLAIELRIWLVSKQLTISNHQPGSRMAASQWKNNIWCGGRALPSLH